MAKIDEVKEILNTLRVVLSLVFGAIVLLLGSIISNIEEQVFDLYFWSAIVVCFALISIMVIIVLKIAQKTKEIREL